MIRGVSYFQHTLCRRGWSRHQTTDDRKRRLAKLADQLHSRPSPLPTRLLATPRSCYCGGEMLAVSGTVENASVNLTRRVAATHESESDRAQCTCQIFRSFDVCTANLTDLRSTNRPNSTFRHVYTFNHRQTNVYALTTRTTAVEQGSSYVLSANRRSQTQTVICSRSSLLMRTHSITGSSMNPSILVARCQQGGICRFRQQPCSLQRDCCLQADV